MLRITNISITGRAAERLDVRRVMTRFEPDDVFSLVYVFNFAEADGTPVEGFFAGCQAVATERKIHRATPRAGASAWRHGVLFPAAV